MITHLSAYQNKTKNYINWNDNKQNNEEFLRINHNKRKKKPKSCHFQVDEDLNLVHQLRFVYQWKTQISDLIFSDCFFFSFYSNWNLHNVPIVAKQIVPIEYFQIGYKVLRSKVVPAKEFLENTFVRRMFFFWAKFKWWNCSWRAYQMWSISFPLIDQSAIALLILWIACHEKDSCCVHGLIQSKIDNF